MASFPSSYIPTTTASATRAADGGPEVASPGVDYPMSGVVRFMRTVDTGGIETLFQIDDGTDNNRVRVAVDASDRAELLVVSGGATQAQIAITGALALNTVHTIAWRVGSNTAHICVNGTLGTEDTTVTVPATPTTIRFGRGVSSALPSFGYDQRVALWNRLLNNSELQAVAPA